MNGSMNDLKEEKGTREELRRSQAAPRRSGGGLKRALMVILALVVAVSYTHLTLPTT